MSYNFEQAARNFMEDYFKIGDNWGYYCEVTEELISILPEDDVCKEWMKGNGGLFYLAAQYLHNQGVLPPLDDYEIYSYRFATTTIFHYYFHRFIFGIQLPNSYEEFDKYLMTSAPAWIWDAFERQLIIPTTDGALVRGRLISWGTTLTKEDIG